MTENIILVALTILPVIVLLVYIYIKDRYEKEPLRMLLAAFGVGCLSVLPILIVELALDGVTISNQPLRDIYDSFVVAGLVEEGFKFALLYSLVGKSRHFNEYFDGIVYAVFVSLGFACIENFSYVFDESTFKASIDTGIVRAILTVPAHFLFAVIMGYHFALAKFNPIKRRPHLFKSLLYPVLAHGCFDFLLYLLIGFNTPDAYNLSAGMLDFLTALAILFFYLLIWRLWRWAKQRMKKMQELSYIQSIGNLTTLKEFPKEEDIIFPETKDETTIAEADPNNDDNWTFTNN